MRFDLFISHASEDKDDFVRPLVAELTKLGLKVWYDESSLKLGDNIRRKIDEGLAKSDYGVVVLSKKFIVKHWTEAELDGLFVREMKGRKVILPVWHGMTKAEVLKYSPLLGGKLAALSTDGVESVASQIFAVIRPNKDSPLSGFRSSGDFGSAQDGAPESIIELLRTLNDVGPILSKLGEPLESKDAFRMLDALQRFFYGENLITAALDKDLRFATDNLLRVLSVDQSDLGYRFGKLETAFSRYEMYRIQARTGYEIPPVERTKDIRIAFHDLKVALFQMVDGKRPPFDCDTLLIRYCVTLADYGTVAEGARTLPKLGAEFHESLRALLAGLISISLNMEFPDTLDRISNREMKGYCDSFWKTYED